MSALAELYARRKEIAEQEDEAHDARVRQWATSPDLPDGPGDLIALAAEIYGVKPHHVTGPRRHTALVRARELVSVRLRYRLKWSLQRIADVFGKDHSSILSLLRGGKRKSRRPASDVGSA